MSEAASATDQNVAASAQVEFAKTRLLFRNAAVGQAVTLVNASILLLTLENPRSHPWAIGWWLLAAVVAVIRFLWARRFESLPEAQQRDPLWRGRAWNGALAAGLMWGMGAIGFMLADAGAGRLIAALVMSGMVAGAVPILSSVPSAYRAYALPIVLGVVVAPLLDYRDRNDLLLVMVSVLFLFAMLRSARYFHDTLDQSLHAEQSMQEMVSHIGQARDAAEMASSAKSQFIGNMSHELRTPLNGVLGMADILSMTTLDAEQRDYLKNLQQEGQRLHRMVEDVLKLAELEAGEIRLEEALFLLDESLTLGLRPYASAAAAKGLSWELSFAPGMPMTRIGDSRRLRQAVGKLVDNAIKFTERGAIKVGVGEAADGQVKIEISDTGSGLSPAQCAAVMTDFTQADASTTRRHSGLGLGLTLTRRIVALLRGHLEIDSTPGQGSTFRLIVPLPAA